MAVPKNSKKISDTAIRSKAGTKAIINALNKRNPLYVVSVIYMDFRFYYKTKEVNKKASKTLSHDLKHVCRSSIRIATFVNY